MPISKVVFPVAGFGTRFLPITKSIPKEMLPILNRPVIEWAMREVVRSGIKTAVMVTGRYKRAIEDYFDSLPELEEILRLGDKTDLLEEIKSIEEMVEVAYIRQKVAMGLGHAILCAKNLVGKEDFAVILTDDVIFSDKPAIKQLMDVYEEVKNPVIAIKEVPMENVNRYGVVKAKKIGERLYLVEDLVEKPDIDEAPSNLAIIGRYVLTNDIFQKLEVTPPGKKGEIQLTDALKLLLKERPIYAYKFEGDHFDCGEKLGFIMANLYLALNDPEISVEITDFVRRFLG